MKVVRSNVFETNSSSCHTVCLASDVDKGIPERTGYPLTFDRFTEKVTVHLDEFGWYGECETPNSKLAYLILIIWQTTPMKTFSGKHPSLWCCDDDLQYITAEQILYGMDDYKRLKNIVLKYFNVPEGSGDMVIEGEGYIDHQSCEEYKNLDDWLKENHLDTDEKITNFIFGESHIVIDNDNH